MRIYDPNGLVTTRCVKITDGLRTSQHSFGERSQIGGPLTAKKEKARDINDTKRSEVGKDS